MVSVVVQEGRAALARLKKERGDFNDWVRVGHALLEGRVAATRGGRFSAAEFAEWMRQHNFNLRPEHRAKLLSVMANLPAIEKWRATLTPLQRQRLNCPIAVLTRYRKSNLQPGCKLHPHHDPSVIVPPLNN